METRGVEAGEPHVPDDGQFEGVVWVAETVGEELAPVLVPDVGLPVRGPRLSQSPGRGAGPRAQKPQATLPQDSLSISASSSTVWAARF